MFSPEVEGTKVPVTTPARIVTGAVEVPQVQTPLMGVPPIAPWSAKEQFGEGEGVVDGVAVTVVEGVTDGEGDTVAAVDGVTDGEAVAVAVGTTGVGVGATEAGAAVHALPKPPVGSVHWLSTQPKAAVRAQSAVDWATVGRQTLGHLSAQIYPLNGNVPGVAHVLTMQRGLAPTQEVAAVVRAAEAANAVATLGAKH